MYERPVFLLQQKALHWHRATVPLPPFSSGTAGTDPGCPHSDHPAGRRQEITGGFEGRVYRTVNMAPVGPGTLTLAMGTDGQLTLLSVRLSVRLSEMDVCCWLGDGTL